MAGESAGVGILGFTLVFVVIFFFIAVIIMLVVLYSEFADFINYMEDAFLNLFSTIENGVSDFFDLLYEDTVELIDELIDDFTPYF